MSVLDPEGDLSRAREQIAELLDAHEQPSEQNIRVCGQQDLLLP